jgi:DNA-directed RNA polymerase specialized sigma24 family protein
MSEETETQDLLRALLVLAIDERESRPRPEEAARTEVLLASAGLGSGEIAQLTGKNPSSVRVTLSRARKKV